MENDELLEAGKRLRRSLGSLENPPTLQAELQLEALKKVEANLLLVEQTPSASTLDAMYPSMDSLRRPSLMRHPDKDVMLLVISCFAQLTKITAPNEPYDRKQMKEIFELIVGSFKELGEMNSPSFKRRFGILKTVEEVKLYTVMLDIDYLVIDMVKHLLSAVSQTNYSNDVHDSIKAIICGVLDESDDISDELLSVLLINLRREMENSSPATHLLCLAVVASCAEKLTPYIREKISSNQEHICNCVHAYNKIVYDICTHENQEINATQLTTASPEVILPPGSGNAEPVATSVENPSVPTSLNPNRLPRRSPRTRRNSEMERTVEAFVEDEKFIGRRIKVWWPKDRQFYEGVVRSYDPNTRKHTILYDDGDREKLLLWKEQWEFIDHVPSSSGI